MQQLISNYRTTFLFRGIVAILFGGLTLVWPKSVLTVLVLLFGAFAVISGITALAAALRNRGEQGWRLLLFESILGILVGTAALIWSGITAFVFLYLLAAWAIITGILEFMAPLAFAMSGGRAVLTALIAVAWLIGVYAIVVGTLHLVVYFVSRSLAARLARQASM